MMTSKADATEAFVWIWLPGATEPVVAGRLDQDGASACSLPMAPATGAERTPFPSMSPNFPFRKA